MQGNRNLKEAMKMRKSERYDCLDFRETMSYLNGIQSAFYCILGCMLEPIDTWRS